MIRKTLTQFLFLVFTQAIFAQQKIDHSISLLSNWGFFDGYRGRGPIVSTEFNFRLTDYIMASPHLLIGYGTLNDKFNSNGNLGSLHSMVTIIEPGILVKISPFPKQFDNLKIIQGFTYPFEECIYSSTDPTYWNGHEISNGPNYVFGFDLDLIKTEQFRFGVDWRVNTRRNRMLLYALGITTTFNINHPR